VTTAKAQVDGRTARRDRNSEAVLDAVRELFIEGNYTPTAEAVAARSGVSLRSVYRYFEDTEALFRAAIARRVAQAEPLFVFPDLGEGELDDRIARLVSRSTSRRSCGRSAGCAPRPCCSAWTCCCSSSPSST
jgi:AcrR family transcriptional regulator